MPLYGLLSEINDRVSESAEQDQTARICRLILLHTLRKRSHGCESQNKDSVAGSYR